MRAMVDLRDVRRSYRMANELITALDGISLQIAPSEAVAITGPSGSGKSTLMHILGCLDQPTSGSYFLDGEDIGSARESDLAQIRNRRIGFVFQSFNLLPRASALRNVMQPLALRGETVQRRREKATAALARVGLASRLSHRPSELSGGQRQRVAIARALCGEPDIIIADEPTGNLDSRTSEEVVDLLLSVRSEGRTLILVTHDLEVARRMDRQIHILDGRITSDNHTSHV
jgi:putative ABC transport system ATP-binding protein